jgi:hypothetical protein
VEYEPPPREWCVDGCLYEGLLTAEGCRRGVCVKYRVWVHSRDRRRWEAKERWRRRRDEEAGGCIKQQVADALWELADRFDVGVWYKKVTEKVGMFRYEDLRLLRRRCKRRRAGSAPLPLCGGVRQTDSRGLQK